MNAVVSTRGNKRREKQLGVRNALGQKTSDVFFHTIIGSVNHKEKYACKALLVRNCGLHPLIHTSALATMVLNVGTGQKR